MGKLQGFAVMTPGEQTEISAKGGKRAHALGKAYEWNPESAREAGRKGGQVTAAKKKAERDKRHAERD